MAKYDRYPETKIENYQGAWAGYEAIVTELRKHIGKGKKTVVIESYIGIDNNEICKNLIESLQPEKIIFADDLAFDTEKINQMVERDLIPEDRVFGLLTHYEIRDFFDSNVLKKTKEEIDQIEGLTVIYGTGASLITKGDILIYADLARWEAQIRYRAGGTNWKIENSEEDILKKYKRMSVWKGQTFFVVWKCRDSRYTALQMPFLFPWKKLRKK